MAKTKSSCELCTNRIDTMMGILHKLISMNGSELKSILIPQVFISHWRGEGRDDGDANM